jgi:hypothetical protein
MYLLITLLALSQIGNHPAELPGDVGYQWPVYDESSHWTNVHNLYARGVHLAVPPPGRADKWASQYRDGWLYLQQAADLGHVQAAALVGLRNVRDPETLPYLAYAARHGVIKACIGLSVVYADSDPYSALVWALIARREHPHRGGVDLQILQRELTSQQVADAKAQAAAFVFG